MTIVQMRLMDEELDLVALCAALGASSFGGPLSRAEELLLKKAADRPLPTELLEKVSYAIAQGEDPLGESFLLAKAPSDRRKEGAFYTSDRIVRGMTGTILREEPTQIVDPGCGSGRFLAVARNMSYVGQLVGIDVDPLATLMTRATLAVLETPECYVVNADYLTTELPSTHGRRAFLGNPPYVRHHCLSSRTKEWAKRTAETMGLPVSGLSGLHALFVLATAAASQHGDVGCYIMSAEWLNSRYGKMLRQLFSGPLGLRRIDSLDPQATAFDDAMSTAAIVTWESGYEGGVSMRRVRRVEELVSLTGGRRVSRNRAKDQTRWSEFFSATPKCHHEQHIPLRDVADVHRGVVTGANNFFVMDQPTAESRGIDVFVRPCAAKAKDLLASGGTLQAGKLGSRLLDLQPNTEISTALGRYLREGERAGVHGGYVCSHREPWWAVRGSKAPDVVMTYMARQPPTFASNPDGVQILNSLHGIHFRDEFPVEFRAALVGWLNQNRHQVVGGRVYHGGLWKFEPRDVEEILIPTFEKLGELAGMQ